MIYHEEPIYRDGVIVGSSLKRAGKLAIRPVRRAHAVHLDALNLFVAGGECGAGTIEGANRPHCMAAACKCQRQYALGPMPKFACYATLTDDQNIHEVLRMPVASSPLPTRGG